MLHFFDGFIGEPNGHVNAVANSSLFITVFSHPMKKREGILELIYSWFSCNVFAFSSVQFAQMHYSCCTLLNRGTHRINGYL